MEHVRMRPSMYIGDVGFETSSFSLWVVDNSIDEAMGHCDTIMLIWRWIYYCWR
jgi:DNA gyrase subunit B